MENEDINLDEDDGSQNTNQNLFDDDFFTNNNHNNINDQDPTWIVRQRLRV